VLVVAPAALLHPAVPQPDGAVLYELLTGHPDREPHELVFLADLTVELRLAHRHLGQAQGGPAGGRRRGDHRLAPGRPQRPPAGRADRRGGDGAGAAAHDLRARAAPQSAGPPGRPGVVAVAAPHQRTSARRPLPVAADTRGLRQSPQWTAVVRTPAAVPDAAVDSGRLAGVQFRSRSDTGSAATIQPSGRHRRVAAVPQAHRTRWQCPQAAACAHCRSRRTAWMVGCRRHDRLFPPCSGAAAVSAVDGAVRTPGRGARRCRTPDAAAVQTTTAGHGRRSYPA
jgi:hypothetical protein